MFDFGRFVADCRAAHAEDRSHKAVREVLAQAVSEPRSVLKANRSSRTTCLTVT
jgi:hypothetical protein